MKDFRPTLNSAQTPIKWRDCIHPDWWLPIMLYAFVGSVIVIGCVAWWIVPLFL